MTSEDKKPKVARIKFDLSDRENIPTIAKELQSLAWDLHEANDKHDEDSEAIRAARRRIRVSHRKLRQIVIIQE